MFEVQVLGTITAVDLFELRLRACGASDGVRFRHVETICKIPPLPGGGVNGKVRLIKANDVKWKMVQEHEVKTKDAARVMKVDSCELRGEVETTIKQLGFIPEFPIGRVGKRVEVGLATTTTAGAGAVWEVEYFLLFDPKSKPNGTLQQCYVIEPNVECWLVTIRHRFEDAKDMPGLLTQSNRLIKCLAPEFQPLSWSALDQEVAK
ncbi:hypothetical protein BASA81_005909 [Batrachochytrium salamandrivorans]|nr:hypothetical protein BASA81_005909 [Batrachochytrium salamandrivorans]